MYLNNLAIGIKVLGLDIDVNGYNLSILLYADEIVSFSRNENDLQVMFVNEWCKKWRMIVNRNKTNIVHFRPLRSSKTTREFMERSWIL